MACDLCPKEFPHCFYKKWEGAETLHFKVVVKNLAAEPKRFKVNIFLDNGKAVGGLIPRKTKKGLVEPGAEAAFTYPVKGVTKQPKEVIDIHIMAFTPEQTQKILAANSKYSSVELSGGVDNPVSTIGVWNVMICQASLDTDLVYSLAKVLFERNSYLMKIHPSAAYTTPENAVKYSPLPLHPGTIKYLEEIN